jgi:hypothetical protein
MSQEMMGMQTPCGLKQRAGGELYMNGSEGSPPIELGFSEIPNVEADIAYIQTGHGHHEPL